ncbi:MAG: hypothetical protein K0S74_1003 [Chlamydiales bacterium]|jgi:hypothetical protein|nr:hypothetical protein [Chlamydiales bacterium]
MLLYPSLDQLLIIENYTHVEETLELHINFLERELSPIQLPHEDYASNSSQNTVINLIPKQKQVDLACAVVKIAITRFKQLPLKEQTTTLNFASFLKGKSLDKYVYDWQQNLVRRIIPIFFEGDYIEQACGTLSLLLTPARKIYAPTSHELYTAYKLTALALFYFDQLNDLQKDTLYELAHITRNTIYPKGLSKDQDQLLDQIKPLFQNLNQRSSNQVKDQIQDIEKPKISGTLNSDLLPIKSTQKKIFIDFISKKIEATSKSAHKTLLEETFEKVPPFLKPEDELKFQKAFKQEEKLKGKQLSKMCLFAYDLMKHYLPPIFDTDNQPFLKFYLAQSLEVLKADISSIMTNLGFSEPRNVNHQEKKLIYNLTLGIKCFLGDLNNALQQTTFPEGINQKLLIESMFQKASIHLKFSNESLEVAQKEQLPLPFHLLQFEIKKILSLLSKSKDLSYSTDKASLDTRYLYDVLALAISQLLNLQLKSDNFLIIISQLLKDVAKTHNLASISPPIAMFDSSDDEFTEQIGEVVVDLAKEIIFLGQPQGALEKFQDSLKNIIEGQKELIGISIQKALNQAFNSESKINLITVLDRLCFERTTSHTRPVLLLNRPQTADQKEDLKRKVQTELEKLIYPLLLEKVRGQFKVAGWLVKKIGSIELFCDTIVKQLIMIIGNDELIKILVSYLMESLFLSFE